MNKLIWCLPLALALSSCASSIKIKDIKPLTTNAQMPSSEEEVSLFKRSKRLHKTLLEKGMIVRNSEANQYLNSIAQQLTPKFSHEKIALNFYILKDASTNAFALPNGNIYINVGLITKLSSDDQLAYVLSHEIVHVIQRHGLKSLVDRKNTVVTSHVADLFLFGTGVIYFGTVAELASFSRKSEQEADRLAVNYLIKTDYNLNEGAEALKRLKEVKYQKEGTSIWGSHPDIQSRIDSHNLRIQALAWDDSQLTVTNNNNYQNFRQPFVKKVIDIRIRNKQFELAEDVIKQELIDLPNSALLHFYLGEVQRLKGTEVEAYAREYAWLHDKTNNEKLLIKLRTQQNEWLSSAKTSYLQAQSLDENFTVTYFNVRGCCTSSSNCRCFS